MIAGVVRKTYMEHKKETFLGINMDLDSSYYIYIYIFLHSAVHLKHIRRPLFFSFDFLTKSLE